MLNRIGAPACGVTEVDARKRIKGTCLGRKGLTHFQKKASDGYANASRPDRESQQLPETLAPADFNLPMAQHVKTKEEPSESSIRRFP